MSCQNHPNKESISNCQFCGKELCEECTISIAGKNYCEECMSELVGPELASIASKSPNTETQNNSIPKVTTPTEPTQIPPEKTDPNIIEPERAKQEIPSQNQNLNNNNNLNSEPYTSHDDIYSDNRLYNDIHGDNSSSNPQSINKVEEKYEKYLDDLYFDEAPENQRTVGSNENIGIREDGKSSLSEQLAQDEAEHGSITKEPFVPDTPEEPSETREFEASRIDKNDRNKNVPIMENLRNVSSNAQNIDKEEEYTHSSLHRGSIHYKKEEKNPLNSTEKALTVILIILIILVVIYVIYLLTLHDQYPSFINAITAFFGNPGEVFSQMFS